jgi:hypothetical protein
MNTRLMGTICIIANALQIVDGVRWAALKLTTNNPLSLSVGIASDLGALCGLIALVALKTTGTNRIFQVLTFLPILGFLGDIINNIAQLANLSGPDTTFSITSSLLILAGCLVVGILTIAAKQWAGWRKLTPLLTCLMFPVALLVRSVTQTTGLISIFMGAAWMLLGYAVLSSTMNKVKPTTLTQPLNQS